MKSKNILYLLIVLGVLVAAFFILRKNPNTTLDGADLRDFAIEDTAAVTKIFIANKNQEKVTLEREPGSSVWIVNGKFQANSFKVNLLLSTMQQIRVKAPVPDVDYNVVVKTMATSGRKVEIFEGDQLVKTYYVGTATADELGTFMLMDGSDIPYILHIPGFNGYLTVRYFIDEKQWKTRKIFTYGPDQLASVKVDYPAQPEHSFVINMQDGTPVITPEISAIQPLQGPDQSMLRYYVSLFEKLTYEGYDIGDDPAKTDSIANSQPYCSISLKGKDGKTQSLRIHFKPVDKRTVQQSDDAGTLLNVDLEKYYAFIGDEKDMVLIQNLVFNKVFRKYQDFDTLADGPAS